MSDWLGLLGLGMRGGLVSIGVEAVRNDLQAGKCRLVVLASDASPRAVEKVGRLAVGRGVLVVAGPEADVIGQRMGRPPVMAVGVRDKSLADGIVRSAAVRQ